MLECLRPLDLGDERDLASKPSGGEAVVRRLHEAEGHEVDAELETETQVDFVLGGD